MKIIQVPNAIEALRISALVFIVGLTLVACGSTPAPVVEARVEITIDPPPVIPKIPVAEPAPKVAEPSVKDTRGSLQPLTVKNLVRAIESGRSYADFQYYISQSVTLRNRNSDNLIQPGDDGEFILWDAAAAGELEIPQETRGEALNLEQIKNDEGDTTYSFTVSFDTDETRQLTFTKNSGNGPFFELQYEGAGEEKTLQYGGKVYGLSLADDDAPPILLVWEIIESTGEALRTTVSAGGANTALNGRLRPFTTERLLQAEASEEGNYERFQYYISKSITLKYHEPAGTVEAGEEGEYILYDTGEHTRIAILDGASGFALDRLQTQNEEGEDVFALSINFAEDTQTGPGAIPFIEDTGGIFDHSFKLQYETSGDVKTIVVAGKTYELDFDGEPPILQVWEVVASDIDDQGTKYVQGRPLTKGGAKRSFSRDASYPDFAEDWEDLIEDTVF
ncbi:hypothetical protein FACS1894200_07790 [Spirochaetia bacterium]|nr:hypothetical protein FACS1894200_07790 [Spirochaetia bacterium]